MEKEFVSNTWAMSGWITSYNAGILALSENMISFISAKGEEFKVTSYVCKKYKVAHVTARLWCQL